MWVIQRPLLGVSDPKGSHTSFQDPFIELEGSVSVDSARRQPSNRGVFQRAEAFHLLKSMFYSPLLVLKGIYH